MVTREELMEELWWEIRLHNQSPLDHRLDDLLYMAYRTGYKEGYTEEEDRDYDT